MKTLNLPKNKVFIIAEAGVNHNGKLSFALKLINEAKKAGVDAIKFQAFKTSDLTTGIQSKMLNNIELSYADFIKIKKHCDKKNIIFLATPHTENAIDFLNPLVPYHKIGSGDLTNIPFLKKIAKKKKPIILSTGMGTMSEIKEAITTIKKQGNNKIILLHCVTEYPCPIKNANLSVISTLKKQFGLPVGYSDHTLGTTAPIMAVAMGVEIIEKHFTIDKGMAGPDHKASLEPMGLRQMVVAIRETKILMGSPIKKPTKNEEKIKKIVRKSICAEINISKNTIITANMLQIKRPGTGIQPKYLNRIIGKKTKKSIKKNDLIKLINLK